MSKIKNRDAVSAPVRKRVLIVDEGGDFAAGIGDTLAAANYHVTVAEDATAAHRALARLMSDSASGDLAPALAHGLVIIMKRKAVKPAILCVTACAFPEPAMLTAAMRGGAPESQKSSDQCDELLAAIDSSFERIRSIQDRAAVESAHRETEQLLHAILENATAVIYAKDREGRYLFVNRMFERIFGLTNESIKGKVDHEIFPASIADAFRRNDLDVVHTGQPLQIEETAPHPDGIHTYMSTKFPLYDADKTIRGVCGISTDITDRKRAAEQLRRAQRMEAVGHLTGGVAHDFNNLNSVVLGNLELLEEQLQPGTQLQTMAHRAIEAARRGALLTERLLAFSERQVLQPQQTNVNSLVLTTVEFLSRGFGETIEIRTVPAGDAWPAFVDPGQLENALINLAVNARDAMPQGGVLTIETRNRELDEYDAVRNAEVTPGSYIQIAVTDTGTGIDAEIRDRVFEPFFTTREVGKGAGLGLSMVYGFVSQSGGHVTIESEVGRGTTVRLLLPRAPDDAAQSGEGAPLPDGCEAQPGESVLVVEDDTEVRHIAAAFLEDLGYRVFQAADAESALTLLRSAPPVDLLLTDVVLPGGMGGRELAAAVRAGRPETRILYMSGYAETGLSPSDLAGTGARLLDKPFNKAQLAATVRAAIDSGPRRPRATPRPK
ncbi:MAG TPA: PAS domain-containing protein [Alphaproteobacteria bacterium]|nr:PAS domain-containing protein [Alphaproteobacteria bacterium]